MCIIISRSIYTQHASSLFPGEDALVRQFIVWISKSTTRSNGWSTHSHRVPGAELRHSHRTLRKGQLYRGEAYQPSGGQGILTRSVYPVLGLNI